MGRLEGVRRFFATDPPWWVRDGLVALFVGALLLASQVVADVRAGVRAERLENLRFVRECSERSECTPDRETGRDCRYRDRPFAGLDLSGQNLSGLQLRGADFRGANLAGADLSDADLSWTNFDGAILDGADLWHTDFDGAHLEGARLIDVDLTAIDASRAVFLDADITGARLLDSDGRGACQTDGEAIWPEGVVPPPSRCPAGGA